MKCMKLGPVASAVVASLLAPLPAMAAGPVSASLYASTCKVDGEIDTAERAKAEAIALGSAQNLVDGDAAAVFESMSNEARSEAGPQAIAKMAQAVKASGPYQDLRVAHLYLIEVKGGRDPLPPMICGKTLLDPDAVALSMKALPQQFHVEITAHTKNNEWSFFAWLVPEQGRLKVLSLHLDMSAMAGRTSRDLHRLALEQNARGHAFSAAMLYRAAEITANRGPAATPVWKRDLDKDIAAFTPPKELTGAPPYVLRSGGQAFSFAGAGVIGVGGNLNLIFERRPDSWPSDAAVDADSRRFVTAITNVHPEFSESFRAIVVRAFKPDGTGGIGTVYEFGKGFD